jgi:hypothetical protein
MKTETIIEHFQENNQANNLQCDGEHCKQSDSIVRIIPLDDSVNVHLCKDCYKVELTISEDRELEGLERILLDLPFEVYPRVLN